MATLLHPVFFTSRATRTIEVHDDHETLGREITYSYVLRGYKEVPPWKGYAIIGQPRMQVRLTHTPPPSRPRYAAWGRPTGMLTHPT